MSKKPVVEAINLIKIYDAIADNRKISALQGCDLEILPGEVVSIIGPSGAGKSTLLRLISGIEQASGGECYIGGYPLHQQNDRLRREFRRKYIGFFTQFGRQNLDPNMSVVDALMWEAINSGWNKEAAKERAHHLLEKLSLNDLSDRKCGKLSAGEAMRVSLVKAVVKKPFIVLADEPTGQLDSTAVYKLIDLMKEVAAEGIAILVATHDIRFQSYADKNYLILNGRLATQEEGKDLLRRRGSFSDIEEGPFSSNTIIDSNNFIRIPDRILNQLDIGKKITLEQQPDEDFAILRKSADDPGITRGRELPDIKPFSRKLVTDTVLISVDKVSKEYEDVTGTNLVLEDIDLHIQQGEVVVILGPSGSGKTTLLNMIGGYEPPTKGRITYDDKNLYQLNATEKHRIQMQEFSYLTQNYTVHPYLSVESNAKLPLILQAKEDIDRDEELAQLLDKLDIMPYRSRYPTSLSGGQQQRVSLSASLMKESKVILADEPTANLDADLAVIVMNLLTEVSETGLTTIVATHDFLSIRPGYRVIRVENRKIVSNRIADQAYCEDLYSQYLNH